MPTGLVRRIGPYCQRSNRRSIVSSREGIKAIFTNPSGSGFDEITGSISDAIHQIYCRTSKIFFSARSVSCFFTFPCHLRGMLWNSSVIRSPWPLPGGAFLFRQVVHFYSAVYTQRGRFHSVTV